MAQEGKEVKGFKAISQELTTEQVAAYEKMSGFKTTGKVTSFMPIDPVWGLYMSLLVPQPPPPHGADPVANKPKA